MDNNKFCTKIIQKERVAVRITAPESAFDRMAFLSPPGLDSPPIQTNSNSLFKRRCSAAVSIGSNQGLSNRSGGHSYMQFGR